MKQPIATLIVPLVFSAVPALAATETSATCDAKYETVSEAWAEAKASLSEVDEVEVATEDGEVDVAAADAKPTENWFGKPPKPETVDGYLEEAERAMQAGDTEACMAQLTNVEAAMAQTSAAALD